MVIVYQFKCDFPTFSAKLNSETNKNNLALFETSEERRIRKGMATLSTRQSP